MRITGRAKDLQGIDRRGKIFPRMPGPPANLYLESNIGCAPRNHHTCLESVIKNNALAYAPRLGIKRARTAQTNLFLDSKNHDERRMRKLLFHHAAQNLQHNG